MSGPLRLLVFSTQHPPIPRWVEAIASAAELAGVRFSQHPSDDDGGNFVLLTDDVSVAQTSPLTDRAVLVSPPEDIDRSRPPSLGYVKLEVMQASARRAWAIAMLHNGAVSLDATAESVVLPGLGVVTPAARDTTGLAMQSGHPLAIYRTLPPQVGAEAVWPAERLSFPIGAEFDGGPSKIDLTGRPRIIVHGPYVELTPGIWRSELDIDIDPEGGVARLKFEWGVNLDVTGQVFEVSEPGRYRVQLDRLWEMQGPVQYRIWVSQAVFKGRVEVHSCRVTLISTDVPAPVAEPEPETATFTTQAVVPLA